MNSKTITINNLFNANLTDIELLLIKADKILSVLRAYHFESTAEALENDSLLELQYKLNYEEIQTMLWIASDFVHEAKKAMDEVMEFRIISNELLSDRSSANESTKD